MTVDRSSSVVNQNVTGDSHYSPGSIPPFDNLQRPVLPLVTVVLAAFTVYSCCTLCRPLIRPSEGRKSGDW